MEQSKGVEKHNLDTYKNMNLSTQALRPLTMCQSAEAAEAVAKEHHEYIFKNLIQFERDANLCGACLMNLCSANIRAACLASMSTMGPGRTS